MSEFMTSKPLIRYAKMKIIVNVIKNNVLAHLCPYV